MSNKQESPAPKFGRTVADARRLADEADVILIAVRISRHDHTYFAIDQKTLAAQFSDLKPHHLIATELSRAASGRIALFIGTLEAIVASEQPENRGE
jgi:hypothetical protein